MDKQTDFRTSTSGNINRAEAENSAKSSSRKSQSLTIACGADFSFPKVAREEPLLRFLLQLEQAAQDQRNRLRAICFTPAPYGSEAVIQSLSETAFAHHTLPGPSIPIPRGVDFIGRHVGEVEAEVHLPLPDAYRTFQLKQAIRSMQRSGEPLLLLAHTPGIIGFHVRREAMKRRMRGKPIPIVATHWSRYQPFVATRVVKIANALREHHGVSLHDFFTHGGSLERLVPKLQEVPEIGAGIERLMCDIQQIFYHWYEAPLVSSSRTQHRLGQMLLWLANSCSRYSHHRLQGSLAAARALQELARLASKCLGVPLTEIQKRPSHPQALFEQGIEDVAGQLVHAYLAHFYDPCDRILNLEGELGRSDLLGLGVPDKKIVDFDLANDSHEQLQEVYKQIAGDSTSHIVPKRLKMADFDWGEPIANHEHVAAHLAISDVHLGDGSGTERSLALLALQPHLQRLGIESIEIVGDLIQRDVPPDVSSRHRASFLASLRHLTGSTASTERSQIRLKVDFLDEVQANPKRLAEIRRELQSFAIKVGVNVSFGEAVLGVPEVVPDRVIPVYVERGNHDEGERLEDVVPGALVSSSMIRYDRSSGVLFCHGNIWNLPEVSNALKRATSFADLIDSLSESRLHSSLETAQVIYSMTSALWRACAKRIDVRGLWKNDLQPSLSRCVQWMRERHGTLGSSESEFSQFLAGVISPVDNAEVAAQCGIVVRRFDQFCWAICDGHSHRPSIEFVHALDPQSGVASGALLVNCGKFHGKNITVVMLRFPEAVVFEWDERDQCYYVLYRRRLTDEELQIVLDANRCIPKVVESVAPPSAVVPTNRASVLLEVCTEGGGHKERQLALLPLYEQHGTVRVAASGDQPLSWAHEHWPGHRMVYDSAGRVRVASTVASYLKRQYSIGAKARSLGTQMSLYTHAITDFAPVLPLAMQIARKAGGRDLPELFHVSHHAALHSRYADTPRPAQLDRLTYWATQRYLNSILGDVNIGFHFERYHPDILPPPISPDILRAQPTFSSNIILVYLSGAPDYIAEQCAQIDPNAEHEWHIYSSRQATERKSDHSHIWLFPLNSSYRAKLPHVRGVLTFSGFMGPAELLHLGKPFVVIPTPGHGEHSFNAAALLEISDVTVCPSISDASSIQQIRKAFGAAKSITKAIQRTGRTGAVGPYDDIRAEVIRKIFGAERGGRYACNS